LSEPSENCVERELLNSEYWNRKVLNIYWCVTLFSVVIEFINLYLTEMDKGEFLLGFIILPTVLQVGLLVATEVLHRHTRRRRDYLLILAGVLMALILINVHMTVHVLLAVVLLPIVMSLIFYDRAKVMFASVASVISYIAIVVFNPEYRVITSFTDFWSMIGILVGGMFTALGIVNRGVEIGAYLQETMLANVEMERLAKTDPLTGLYNVREFKDSLQKYTTQAHQRAGRLSLLLVDIDHFKVINDTYGHPVGDEVLKEVGKVLTEVSRTFDIVCRNGGEEFSILLPDCTLATAMELGERVRRTIDEHSFALPDGNRVSVTVSVGVSAYPETAQSAQDLYAFADDALYLAKSKGRNRVMSSLECNSIEAG